MITQEYIQHVYDELADALAGYYDSAYRSAEAQQKLEWAKSKAIQAGLSGKNVAERDAELRAICETEYREYEAAELDLVSKKNILETANARRSMLDKMVRMSEVEIAQKNTIQTHHIMDVLDEVRSKMVTFADLLDITRGT